MKLRLLLSKNFRDCRANQSNRKMEKRIFFSAGIVIDDFHGDMGQSKSNTNFPIFGRIQTYCSFEINKNKGSFVHKRK